MHHYTPIVKHLIEHNANIKHAHLHKYYPLELIYSFNTYDVFTLYNDYNYTITELVNVGYTIRMLINCGINGYIIKRNNIGANHFFMSNIIDINELLNYGFSYKELLDMFFIILLICF